MSGRIDPECNLICEFPAAPQKQHVSQKRRAVVDLRPALCGPNDYPAARQTTKSIPRYEGGRHEKSPPPDSRFTRDMYVLSHTRAHTYRAIAPTNVETRTSARMHVAHPYTQYRVPIGVTVRCIRGTRAAIPGVQREARLRV